MFIYSSIVSFLCALINQIFFFTIEILFQFKNIKGRNDSCYLIHLGKKTLHN